MAKVEPEMTLGAHVAVLVGTALSAEPCRFFLLPDRIPQTHTVTTTSREVLVGRLAYQVFSDRRSGRELFRVLIGDQEVRWWSYGIHAEGDFNGDGQHDYCWSGGDDTSHEKYLLVSSGPTYRAYDLLKSLANEWARRFGGKPPDLPDFARFEVTNVELEGGSNALRLSADVEVGMVWARPKARRLVVPRERFVAPPARWRDDSASLT